MVQKIYKFQVFIDGTEQICLYDVYVLAIDKLFPDMLGYRVHVTW